jgi:hypothetical protein
MQFCFQPTDECQNAFILNRRGGPRHPVDFQGLLPFLRAEVFGPDAWGIDEGPTPPRSASGDPCPLRSLGVLWRGASVRTGRLTRLHIHD